MSERTENFVCVIDLGSSEIRACGAQIEFGKVKKTSIGKYKFPCVYQTESDFLKNAETGISYVMDKIESELNHIFERVWLTGRIGETFSKLFIIKKDFERPTFINESLIQKLLEEKLKSTANSDSFLLHIFSIQYIIDNSLDNKNVINTQGRNFSSIFHSIHINETDLENRITMLKNAYLEPEEFFDEMTCLPDIIKEDMKEDGVLIIDMGAVSTKFGLIKNNKLLLSDKIELYGGEDLTNALAETLETTRDIAELAKIEYGKTNPTNALQDLIIQKDNEEYYFSISEIQDLIVGWTNELFRSIYDTLEGKQLVKQFNNIILLGNGSKLKGTKDIAEMIFDTPIITLESPEDAVLLSATEKICYKICEEMQQDEKHNQEWQDKINNFSMWLSKIFKKKPREIKNPIMPSVLSFENYLSPILYKEFDNNGIDILHLDIMDGKYVNNTMGNINEVKTIRKLTKAYLHTHLMIENPIEYVEEYIKAGSDIILISSDSNDSLEAVKKIKSLGKKAGVVIKPSVGLSTIREFLSIVDEVLVMTVEPGFSGQSFMSKELERIRKLYEYRARHQLNWVISVDGGINPETYQFCKIAGADRFVVGSYLAQAENLKQAIKNFKI